MTRGLRIRIAARICLVFVLVVRGALAQPVSDSSEAHVQRGIELRRSGEDAAALAEFERAQALEPSPRVRAQIGFALQALGRWREAEEVQMRVLAEADAWVREHSDLVRESLAAVQHHLSWLSVECDVAGAELTVNGVPAGRLPLSNAVRVVAGAVVLEVRADGYDPVRRTTDVPAGAQARESVVLVRSQATPPNTTLAAEPAKDAGVARRTAGWVTLAGGALLVSGGIVAAVVSAVYSARYNDDTRCFVGTLTRDQNCGIDRGIADTTRITGIAALAAGGLAVGGGVLLLVTSPRARPASPAATLACGMGPGLLGCAGRF
jgi:hypothetical protein